MVTFWQVWKVLSKGSMPSPGQVATLLGSSPWYDLTSVLSLTGHRLL